MHVIHMDDHGVPRADRKEPSSFEDPENINWISLAEAVVASNPHADVLIIEGFCLLDAQVHFPSLHGLVHALIWLDTTLKLVVRHRAPSRYPRGHWLDMEDYVKNCLWPAHEAYKRRSQRDLDVSTRVLRLSSGDTEAHMYACYGSVRRWAFGAASVNQRIIGSVAEARDPGVSWLDREVPDPSGFLITVENCVGGCGEFSYIPTSGLCRTLDRSGVLGVTVGLRVPPRK